MLTSHAQSLMIFTAAHPHFLRLPGGLLCTQFPNLTPFSPFFQSRMSISHYGLPIHLVKYAFCLMLCLVSFSVSHKVPTQGQDNVLSSVCLQCPAQRPGMNVWCLPVQMIQLFNYSLCSNPLGRNSWSWEHASSCPGLSLCHAFGVLAFMILPPTLPQPEILSIHLLWEIFSSFTPTHRTVSSWLPQFLLPVPVLPWCIQSDLLTSPFNLLTYVCTT